MIMRFKSTGNRWTDAAIAAAVIIALYLVIGIII